MKVIRINRALTFLLPFDRYSLTLSHRLLDSLGGVSRFLLRAMEQGLSLDAALDFFYHSQVYQLIRDGVSDMHCMSDAYLAEELKQEYEELV